MHLGRDRMAARTTKGYSTACFEGMRPRRYLALSPGWWDGKGKGEMCIFGLCGRAKQRQALAYLTIDQRSKGGTARRWFAIDFNHALKERGKHLAFLGTVVEPGSARRMLITQIDQRSKSFQGCKGCALLLLRLVCQETGALLLRYSQGSRIIFI